MEGRITNDSMKIAADAKTYLNLIESIELARELSWMAFSSNSIHPKTGRRDLAATRDPRDPIEARFI